MEIASVQFKVFTGNAIAARKHVKELTDFAARTPFQFEQVAQASRLLKTFDADMTAGAQTLRIIGDAAAGVSAEFGEVAMWFGRAIDALKAGRPFGEASARLQELGILSGTARGEIERLASEGGDAIGALVEVFEKFDGSMKDLSETTAGLESTGKDVNAQFWGMVVSSLRLQDAYRSSIEAITKFQRAAVATAEATDDERRAWKELSRQQRRSFAGIDAFIASLREKEEALRSVRFNAAEVAAEARRAEARLAQERIEAAEAQAEAEKAAAKAAEEAWKEFSRYQDALIDQTFRRLDEMKRRTMMPPGFTPADTTPLLTGGATIAGGAGGAQTAWIQAAGQSASELYTHLGNVEAKNREILKQAALLSQRYSGVSDAVDSMAQAYEGWLSLALRATSQVIALIGTHIATSKAQEVQEYATATAASVKWAAVTLGFSTAAVGIAMWRARNQAAAVAARSHADAVDDLTMSLEEVNAEIARLEERNLWIEEELALREINDELDALNAQLSELAKHYDGLRTEAAKARDAALDALARELDLEQELHDAAMRRFGDEADAVRDLIDLERDRYDEAVAGQRRVVREAEEAARRAQELAQQSVGLGGTLERYGLTAPQIGGGVMARVTAADFQTFASEIAPLLAAGADPARLLAAQSTAGVNSIRATLERGVGFARQTGGEIPASLRPLVEAAGLSGGLRFGAGRTPEQDAALAAEEEARREAERLAEIEQAWRERMAELSEMQNEISERREEAELAWRAVQETFEDRREEVAAAFEARLEEIKAAQEHAEAGVKEKIEALRIQQAAIEDERRRRQEAAWLKEWQDNQTQIDLLKEIRDNTAKTADEVSAIPKEGPYYGPQSPGGLEPPGGGDESQFEHRARGGPVSAGMPYIVGEHGAEVFVPRQSGRIIPRGGGGVTNIYITTFDPQKAADLVADGYRESGNIVPA